MKEVDHRIRVVYEKEMEPNPHPGIFVNFEGLDGCGKSVQINNLVRYLEDNYSELDIWMTKEPTDGPVGSPIRHILSRKLEMDPQTLQMMFTTDRSDHLGEPRGIISHLKNGSLVATARFLWSTVAYGYAEGLEEDWLLAMQSRFPLPDLNFFLKISPEVSFDRMRRSRLGLDLFERLDKLQRVEKGYEMLIEKYPNQFIVLDGAESIDSLNSQIIERVENHPKFSIISRKSAESDSFQAQI